MFEIYSGTILDCHIKFILISFHFHFVAKGITPTVLQSIWDLFQDFTVDFYFRQFWNDPRLSFEGDANVETLSVGSEFTKNIWMPDTFFVNEKKSYFHVATTSNEFIRIHHTGSITRSIR